MRQHFFTPRDRVVEDIFVRVLTYSQFTKIRAKIIDRLFSSPFGNYEKSREYANTPIAAKDKQPVHP